MKSTSRSFLIAGLVTGMMSLGFPALAQNAGFYGGIAVGAANIKDLCEGATTCEDRGLGWKILGGYQVNKTWAAELGYVSFGKTGAANPAIPENMIFKGKGFEILGVGTIPLSEKVSAYGKLGLFRWDIDLTGGSLGVPFALSEKGSDLTFGLGLKYDFTKTVGARMEWQRYRDIGKSATTGTTDIDLMSIGAVFKF